MKRTLLKINDLSQQSEHLGKLSHVSLHILAGEVTALLGLVGSGKELLIKILSGQTEVDWRRNHFYLLGNQIRNYSQLSKVTCHISAEDSLIQDWTVAEYISLRDVSWYLSRRTRRRICQNAQTLLEDLDLDIDVTQKIKHLGELKKRMVEIVWARKEGARILILEDECEGMSPEELVQYASFLKKIIQERIGIILLCNARKAAEILADNYYIFRKGRVVKKRNRHVPYDSQSISRYILGGTMVGKKKSLDSYRRNLYKVSEPVYGIRDMQIHGCKYDTLFKRSEVTVFSISNHRERHRVFMELSGRAVTDTSSYLLGGDWVRQPNFKDFLAQKIVSLMRTSRDYEAFEDMSVGDNLLLPSIRKVPQMDYLLSGGKITQVLSHSLELDHISSHTKMKNLDNNQHIVVSLNRWYIFKPRAIIMYDPFIGCDEYTISLILSYIKKFTNLGSAVILVKSNLEYTEKIADRTFSIG